MSSIHLLVEGVEEGLVGLLAPASLGALRGGG